MTLSGLVDGGLVTEKSSFLTIGEVLQGNEYSITPKGEELQKELRGAWESC